MRRHALASAFPRVAHGDHRPELAEVRAALSAPRASIPLHLLLDDRGSELLATLATGSRAAIAGARLLEGAAEGILREARFRELLDGGAVVGRRIGPLLERATVEGRSLRCLLTHPHERVLLERLFNLQLDHPGMPLVGVLGDITRQPSLAPEGGDRLVTLLGNTFGLLATSHAGLLLAVLARHLGADGALVLELDLVKERRALERDAGERLAANLGRHALEVVNRLFGADFDADSFAPAIRYDARRRRLDATLRARRRLTIGVRDAGLRLEFREEQDLVVLSERKFTRGAFERMAQRAGLALLGWHADRDEMVALAVLRPA